MKELAKEQILTNGHRHQCGNDQRENGMRAAWKWVKREVGDGDICNNVSNKNKVKINQ